MYVSLFPYFIFGDREHLSVVFKNWTMLLIGQKKYDLQILLEFTHCPEGQNGFDNGGNLWSM